MSIPAFHSISISYICITVLAVFIASVVTLCTFVAFLRWILRRRSSVNNENNQSSRNRPTIAFMHPYCNSGGGGERVLWCAVKAVAEHRDEFPCRIVIYTGDVDVTSREMLQRVFTTFNISLPADLDLQFIYLEKRNFIEASSYPRITLMGQSLGSIVLGWEGLSQLCPDIFIDTTGLSFIYPLAKYIAGCTVVTYTHYPTISTDMLRVVRRQEKSYNNNNTGFVYSKVKLLYYYLFAGLYSIVGRCSDIVMVNSTWTKQHISYLWGRKCTVLYPPCDTQNLQNQPTLESERNTTNILGIEKFYNPNPSPTKNPSIGKNCQLRGRRLLLSIGQFRPEKNHALQLQSLRALIDLGMVKNSPQNIFDDVLLVIVGSCRNQKDLDRVESLRILQKELQLEDNVIFVVNAPYSMLKQLLGRCIMGLHTMRDEHFGIGIVEMLASGCGPQCDIIKPNVNVNDVPININKGIGFLANSPEEYAKALSTVLHMRPNDLNQMRKRGRLTAKTFSQQHFEKKFWQILSAGISKYNNKKEC